MRKQSNSIILSAILSFTSLLLIAGCGGGQPAASVGVGGLAPSPVPTQTTAAASAAVGSNSSDGSPSTNASPVPPGLTATLQAGATTAPADQAPTADVATTIPLGSPTAEATQANAASQPAENSQSQGTGGDAADAVFRAIQARGAATSYREKLTTPEDAPGTSEIIDVINPDRSHEVASEGGNITRELIGIGADIYSKNGQEAWVKIPPRSADAQAKIDSLKLEYGSIDAFRKSISDAHDLGTEDLDGTATKTYQYMETQTSVTRGMTVTISSVDKLWVAAGDGLPRKLSIDSTTQYSGHSRNTKVSIFFYDYNVDIKIEAPMP